MLIRAMREGEGGDDDDGRHPPREWLIPDDEWQDHDDELEEEKEEEKHDDHANKETKTPSDPSQPQAKALWKKHIHKHDNIRGISYIHHSLQEEHENNFKKTMESRLSAPKREKPSNRSLQPSSLLRSQQSQKAQASQTFIPNEVIKSLSVIPSQ